MLSYTEAKQMTYAELLEANEAFDELLDLKKKQAESERDKISKTPKLKFKAPRRISRR